MFATLLGRLYRDRYCQKQNRLVGCCGGSAWEFPPRVLSYLARANYFEGQTFFLDYFTTAGKSMKRVRKGHRQTKSDMKPRLGEQGKIPFSASARGCLYLHLGLIKETKFFNDCNRRNRDERVNQEISRYEPQTPLSAQGKLPFIAVPQI